MKPKLMQGHERAITAVRYNTTGDILFSTAKVRTGLLRLVFLGGEGVD